MKSLLIIVLLIGSTLSAQISDTLKFNEVLIKAKKITPAIGHVQAISSEELQNQSQSDLGSLLQEKTNIHVKNYGNGQLATPSFRGTSASHTTVFWNGVSLNNPMLGLLDLSTLLTSSLDEIEIHSGGSSLVDGEGGLGGSLHLNSSSNWNKEGIKLNFGYGSFDTKNLLFDVKKQINKWKIQMTFGQNTSDNNFTYLDYTKSSSNPPLIRRTDNQFYRENIASSIAYQPSLKNKFSFDILYNNMHKSLPGNLLNIGLPSLQQDERLASTIKWRYIGNYSNLIVQSSYQNNSINYMGSIESNPSLSMFHEVQNTVRWNTNISNNLEYGFSYFNRYTTAQSNGYNGTKTRFQNSAHLHANYLFKKWHFNFIARQNHIDNQFSPFLPSIGTEYHITNDWTITAQANRNFRQPTLNDLYWENGGNPNLKPEEAFQYEIGTKFKDLITFNIYHHSIENWIQWIPQSNGIWSPENVKNVRINGIEMTLNKKWENLSISNNFQLNQSIDLASNNILIYSPIYNEHLYLNYRFKKAKIGFNHHVVSKRFLTTNNTSYLPWYQYSNAFIQYQFKNKHKFRLNIDNIFNQSYQVVSWFPMPLRAFHLKYQFTWEKE